MPEKRRKAVYFMERVLVCVLCVIVCTLMLFPLYYMVISSFKTMEEYMQSPPTLFPHVFSFKGYSAIFEKIDIFGRFFCNSLYVSVLVPIVQTAVCLPAAYALARMRFRFRNAIFVLFLSSMMVPGQLTIIQNYATFAKLGLINNINSIVLLNVFSPLCLYLMKQFFSGLPRELEEAGMIDGCNALQNFLYIVAPLSAPIVAVNLILCFNGVWGDFFAPMILLKTQRSMTLPVGLTVIMGALRTQDPTVLMAALTITCIPVLIVFFAFRNKLIEGIAVTGIKM